LTDYRKYTTRKINPLAISTKIPHWLQQKATVNGIETYSSTPFLSGMTACSMHIKTIRVTSQNY